MPSPFSGHRLGGLTLPNRTVTAPMRRGRAAAGGPATPSTAVISARPPVVTRCAKPCGPALSTRTSRRGQCAAISSPTRRASRRSPRSARKTSTGSSVTALGSARASGDGADAEAAPGRLEGGEAARSGGGSGDQGNGTVHRTLTS
jgi:branched-subunit amino acid aminotransferase/4-amino-4-deoxychorismate lyase